MYSPRKNLKIKNPNKKSPSYFSSSRILSRFQELIIKSEKLKMEGEKTQKVEKKKIM